MPPLGEVIWCTADTGWNKADTSTNLGPPSCGACSYLFEGPFVPKDGIEPLGEASGEDHVKAITAPLLKAKE